MEEPLQQAFYGGNITGRRLRGVKINPIYQDIDRSATHKDDNDTQSESALPIGEIQIEMYESLPRNKQKIFKQSNSTPSLWSPNSSFEQDYARPSEVCSPGAEADETRRAPPLERKPSQKSQAKDQQNIVCSLPWTHLDSRSSPRLREPVWDAFKKVEKKIPPKLREESLEVVSNDSSDEVKSVVTADNEKRTAVAMESPDNEADTINVLPDWGRLEPAGDECLPPGHLRDRDDSFRRPRITTSSYLDHLVQFVLEDSSDKPPSQGSHPNPTCCFSHFCIYCLPHLQQQQPGRSEKTDDASCKLFRNLLATEKEKAFMMKNEIKNLPNQASGKPELERWHPSSDKMRMLLSLGTDVHSHHTSGVAEVCRVRNSALHRPFEYVRGSENFSKQMIALSDGAHGRNGLTLGKALSRVQSLLDTRTYGRELSHLPNSDRLITNGYSLEKKLKTTDDATEVNNEERSQRTRNVCDKDDERGVTSLCSDEVFRRETTTECLHHGYFEDEKDRGSYSDTARHESGINRKATCDLPVQKGQQDRRSEAVYFHDSPSESDDEATFENSADCDSNANGPLVAAEADDFLDNNNYLEGVDMCTSPWCERCREVKTVRDAPSREARVSQDGRDEQRRVAWTVTLTEVCQETCIFHGKTLSRGLEDSSEQDDQKPLDDDEQCRNSAPSPGGRSCTTAPTDNGSVILRAEELNAPAYLQSYLEEAQRQYLSLTKANSRKTDIALIGVPSDPDVNDILDENFIREQVAAVDAACEDALRRQKAASAKESGAKKRDRRRFFSFKDRKSPRAGSDAEAGPENNKVIRASIEDVDAEEDESGTCSGSCYQSSGSDKALFSRNGLSILPVGGITTDDPAFEMITADDSYEESPYTTRRRQRMQDSGMDGWKESPTSSLKDRIVKAAVCTFLILFVIGLIIGLAIHFGGSSVRNSTDIIGAGGGGVSGFSGSAYVPGVVRRR